MRIFTLMVIAFVSTITLLLISCNYNEEQETTTDSSEATTTQSLSSQESQPTNIQERQYGHIVEISEDSIAIVMHALFKKAYTFAVEDYSKDTFRIGDLVSFIRPPRQDIEDLKQETNKNNRHAIMFWHSESPNHYKGHIQTRQSLTKDTLIFKGHSYILMQHRYLAGSPEDQIFKDTWIPLDYFENQYQKRSSDTIIISILKNDYTDEPLLIKGSQLAAEALNDHPEHEH